MRILFLSEQFFPEVNAGASRTLGHAREWKDQGAEVTVLTCAPNFPRGELFPGYRNKLYQKEIISGLNVVRVWTYIARNAGFFKRILDFSSFAFSSFWAGLWIRTDVVIVTSPQFLAVFSAYALSTIKRVPWVFEVRDLWPESIAGLNWLSEKSLVYRMLEHAELFLYRKASRIVVVTQYFKEDLIRRGISAAKIDVVENGIDLEDFTLSEDTEILKQRIGLGKKFIVGYVGTLGEAQDFDFVLKCAKILESEVTFLFVGDGAVRDSLIGKAKDLGLTNIDIRPMVPRREVKNFLGACDLSLICLKNAKVFEKVIPSKIFEAANMEIPLLLSASGQARSFVTQHGLGLIVEQGNVASFVATVRAFRHSTEQQTRFKKACQVFCGLFQRRQMALKVWNILKELNYSGRPS